MKITFLSTVTPNELLRSSLPYSYMDVEVSSMDGNSHDVQIYTDISAEWVSGDHSAAAQWKYGVIRGQSQPNPVGPVAASSSSASTIAPTTYGTETSYLLETSVAHTNKPHHAVGQGFRPTHFHHSPAPQQTGAHRRWNVRSAPKNQTFKSGGVAYHSVFRQQQLEFSEIDQQADWGYWVCAKLSKYSQDFA